MDNVKLLSFTDKNGFRSYSFYCPVCEGHHRIKTKDNIQHVPDSASLGKYLITDFDCQGFTKDVQVPFIPFGWHLGKNGLQKTEIIK